MGIQRPLLNCVFLMLLGPFDVPDGRAESLMKLRQPCMWVKHGQATENNGQAQRKPDLEVRLRKDKIMSCVEDLPTCLLACRPPSVSDSLPALLLACLSACLPLV